MNPSKERYYTVGFQKFWDQWFECLHNCIPERCNDNIWISLLAQHFSEEINAWVNDDN